MLHHVRTSSQLFSSPHRPTVAPGSHEEVARGQGLQPPALAETAFPGCSLLPRFPVRACSRPLVEPVPCPCCPTREFARALEGIRTLDAGLGPPGALRLPHVASFVTADMAGTRSPRVAAVCGQVLEYRGRRHVRVPPTPNRVPGHSMGGRANQPCC